MNEDNSFRPEPEPLEQQQNNHEPLQKPVETATNRTDLQQLADLMPQSYIGRWLLYLDDIDAGRLPAQRSYDCWCQECWEAKYAAGEDGSSVELVATNTTQVRDFIQQHEGHDVDLTMEGEQKQVFADLETRARNILLGEAVYRRHWVATMSNQELQELPGVGPKILNDIRRHIPYSGPPEAEGDSTSPKWERCSTCYGTGLKLSDTALSSIVQQVSDLEAGVGATAEDNSPEPVPSIEELLMRLTSAIEEINSRLAVLEKDREQGLATPRIVMSVYDAAKAVGVRDSVVWDAVREGELPFVRVVKGCPMIRSDALQEWVQLDDVRIQRKLEPFVYVPPPERLCSRCGEREYRYRRGDYKLCRQCQEQVKQERIDEKERKRAERLARKKHSDQP